MRSIGLRSRSPLSVVAGDGMLMPSAACICAPFYSIILKKKMYGSGYNAARDLNSRDIAEFPYYLIYLNDLEVIFQSW